MKYRILFCCVVCAFAVASTPAQTSNTWTLNCLPSGAIAQSIQTGSIASSILQESCSGTGNIGGAAAQAFAVSVYQESSATLFKAWGLMTETLASGDLVTYAFQSTAAVRNGVMVTGVRTYQITGGTGSVKGILGSGTCNIAYLPGGGSTSTCSGSYKLP